MRHFGTLFIKIFILLIFTCCVSGTEGFSADKQKDKEKPEATEKPENAPEIKFDELSHDFGKSFQNSSLKHTFKFKNVGKGVLNIEKVKAG